MKPWATILIGAGGGLLVGAWAAHVARQRLLEEAFVANHKLLRRFRAGEALRDERVPDAISSSVRGELDLALAQAGLSPETVRRMALGVQTIRELSP